MKKHQFYGFMWGLFEIVSLLARESNKISTITATVFALLAFVFSMCFVVFSFIDETKEKN